MSTRRIGKILGLALLTFCLNALPLQAASLELSGTAIEVTVPAKWHTVHSGPQGLVLRSGDGSLDVILYLLEPDQANSMLASVLTRLKSKLSEPLTHPSVNVPVRFKEYPARFVNGTGKIAGKPVTWECALLEMEKTVIVVRLNRGGAGKQAEKEFDALLQSLKLGKR